MQVRVCTVTIIFQNVLVSKCTSGKEELFMLECERTFIISSFEAKTA